MLNFCIAVAIVGPLAFDLELAHDSTFWQLFEFELVDLLELDFALLFCFRLPLRLLRFDFFDLRERRFFTIFITCDICLDRCATELLNLSFKELDALRDAFEILRDALREAFEILRETFLDLFDKLERKLFLDFMFFRDLTLFLLFLLLLLFLLFLLNSLAELVLSMLAQLTIFQKFTTKHLKLN